MSRPMEVPRAQLLGTGPTDKVEGPVAPLWKKEAR